MGGRNISPSGPVPFSKMVANCSSVKLGRPAKGGAVSAQGCIGATGLIQMLAPCSQASVCRSPRPFRGVWHSPHIATSSTRYFPRSTSALREDAAFCALAKRHDPKATRARAKQTTPIAASTDLTVMGIGFSSRLAISGRREILHGPREAIPVAPPRLAQYILGVLTFRWAEKTSGGGWSAKQFGAFRAPDSDALESWE